jgi:hypothetical protein
LLALRQCAADPSARLTGIPAVSDLEKRGLSGGHRPALSLVIRSVGSTTFLGTFPPARIFAAVDQPPAVRRFATEKHVVVGREGRDEEQFLRDDCDPRRNRVARRHEANRRTAGQYPAATRALVMRCSARVM